jgi:hypothetical protein
MQPPSTPEGLATPPRLILTSQSLSWELDSRARMATFKPSVVQQLMTEFVAADGEMHP